MCRTATTYRCRDSPPPSFPDVELAGFDELVAYEVADKAIPSISYVLFEKNDVLEWRNVASGAALRDDSLFRIGSVSKTFAAILAMRLVGQGKLDLDADIAAVIDGFSPIDPMHGAPVTLRKLLSHRSGLTREAGPGGYLDPHAPTLAVTVEGLAGSRLKAASDGSQYHYSNAGYAVVGRAVELAAGAAMPSTWSMRS
jgi:CubicO group peptidase (beta-lactamase class C family)